MKDSTLDALLEAWEAEENTAPECGSLDCAGGFFRAGIPWPAEEAAEADRESG